MSDLPDRETVRKALEMVGGPSGRSWRGDHFLVSADILDVARAFVDGRLIDRQTLDYESALGALRLYLADDYPSYALGWQMKVTEKVIDAAVGEGEQ